MSNPIFVSNNVDAESAITLAGRAGTPCLDLERAMARARRLSMDTPRVVFVYNVRRTYDGPSSIWIRATFHSENNRWVDGYTLDVITGFRRGVQIPDWQAIGRSRGTWDLAERYRCLSRAMQWVSCLSTNEAGACIRDHKDGFNFSGEAVQHFGGPRAVLRAAMAARHRIPR
jgi:hypothetical protein